MRWLRNFMIYGVYPKSGISSYPLRTTLFAYLKQAKQIIGVLVCVCMDFTVFLLSTMLQQVQFVFGRTAPRASSFRCFYSTHNDTPQSVGILRTSDKADAETSTTASTVLYTLQNTPHVIVWHYNARCGATLSLQVGAAASSRLLVRNLWYR
jgi:hypothetical protein